MDKNKMNMYGITSFPDFEGKKAYILGGAFFGDVVRLFAEAGFERADSVEEADVVVFSGGTDVNPALYGAQRHPRTQASNTTRDEYEKAVYELALKEGKIMYGICRGAQFLHVMNGGELWQHVEGHAGPDHLIYDLDDDLCVEVTSYHHQMLALNTKLEVLAVCVDQISRRFESDTMTLALGESETEIEIEAGYYLDTKCLFVQGHPEVGSPEYRSWSMAKLKDFMMGYMDSDRPADDMDVESALELWRQQTRCM